MIISIINNKGGTGKTTTSINFSAALAAKGYSVLLVDLDAQANASLSLGIPYSKLSPSISDSLFDEIPINDVIRNTNIKGLDLITGNSELVNSDLILDKTIHREKTLKHLFSSIKKDYDFIICDCSPALSLLSINVLIAADKYIIPLIPEYLSLEGLITTINTIKKIKPNLNPMSVGILFTMVKLKSQSLGNREQRLQSEIIKLVVEKYRQNIFKNYIPRDYRFSESISYGRSIFDFAPKSKAAFVYEKLTNEFLNRFNPKTKKAKR